MIKYISIRFWDVNQSWTSIPKFLIFLIKYLFCFIPKLSFKFIENITQCTEKLKRTFLAFQFRYLLIWHKNRRCDATCIFDECTDKELFFYLAAQNHLKVFKKKSYLPKKRTKSKKNRNQTNIYWCKHKNCFSKIL